MLSIEWCHSQWPWIDP